MSTSKRKHPPPSLRRGDVIKTHPREGFWGCAVVLTDPRAEGRFQPMCHIGITPFVMRRDYEWAELEGAALCVLDFERGVRIRRYQYGTRHEICIGIYTAYSHPALPVIGSIEPARVFASPLTFDVGDATAGRYPLCGPLAPHLGSEAVTEWLRMNDPVRWQTEQDAARESYERTSEALRAEGRRKKQTRRRRKRGA